MSLEFLQLHFYLLDSKITYKDKTCKIHHTPINEENCSETNTFIRAYLHIYLQTKLFPIKYLTKIIAADSKLFNGKSGRPKATASSVTRA